MEKLFDIQRVMIEQFEKLPFYSRKLFQEITYDNSITGIVGARGIGKTTYLLHQAIEAGAKQRKALYISADNLFFLKHRLIDLVDYLYKETHVRLLCIDEVHKYSNWNQELKNCADTYREFKILFSGSSMIDLVRAKYDLSRRVTLIPLHGLSFREYLDFYLDEKLPLISFSDLIEDHQDISHQITTPHILKHFHEYLRTGYYPFFKEFEEDREKFQAIENAIQKTIYEDIGLMHSLKTPTMPLIEKIYKYIINSAPGELNAYRLASTLGKDFESISTYLTYLQQAGIIRFLYPKKTGKAYLRNPTKMYPENFNLIHAAYIPISQDHAKGKIRETFVINQVQNCEIPIYYSNQGDFRIRDTVVEVGGRSKKINQIKSVKNGVILADDILTGSKKMIPLFLIGLLY